MCPKNTELFFYFSGEGPPAQRSGFWRQMIGEKTQHFPPKFTVLFLTWPQFHDTDFWSSGWMSGVTPAFSYKILDFLNLSEGPKLSRWSLDWNNYFENFSNGFYRKCFKPPKKINFRKRFRNQNEKKLKNFETF